MVTLAPEDIEELHRFKNAAKRSRREYDRANILLLLHKGKRDAEIEDFLEVDRTTIWRTKKRFLEEGLVPALEEILKNPHNENYAANIASMTEELGYKGMQTYIEELLK